MSISPVNIPDNFKPKGFWKRPEGTAGWVTLGGVGVALFWFWGKIVPFVLTTLQNTVWMVVWAGVLWLIVDTLFGVTSVGNLIRNIFASVLRGITSIFVTIDPIGILKNALDAMKDERQKLIGMIERFHGTLTYLENKLKERIAQFQKLTSEAQYAQKTAGTTSDAIKKQRLQLQSQTNLENAGLLKSGIENLQSLLKETQSMLTGFQQWDSIAEAKIMRTEFKVEHLSDQRKVILGAQKALSAGKRLLRGNPEQLKLVDMATEYLAEDAARTLGEMREFSRFTDRLQLEQQIESGAAAENLAAQLAEFNQRLLNSADTLRSSDEIQVPGQPNTFVQQAPSKSGSSDFDSLFSSNKR